MQLALQQRRRPIPWITGVGALVLIAVGFSLVQSNAGASDDVPLVRPPYNFPSGDTSETFQGSVGRAECGPGSNPETSDVQGSVPVAQRESGRSAAGYWCNMDLVGHYGSDDPQGFEGAEWQLARYGTCAYYSQRLWNPRSKGVSQQRPGTVVLDVANPTDPKFVTNIATPGMYDPWETLKISKQRGLLAAVNVMDGEGVAFMGIYDVKEDCRDPKKLFDGPITALNHEGTFSHDGMTYYSGGLTPGIISAIDVSDPSKPKLLTTFFAKLGIHGMSTSTDGNRLYLSHIREDWAGAVVGGTGSDYDKPGQGSKTQGDGMGIYDISEIQSRKPNPQVRLVSALSYGESQVGQHTLNFLKDGKPYVIEVSEAGHGGGRIFDISDEKQPRAIAKIRTEIMMPVNKARAFAEISRPGKENGGDLPFGYNFHYCNIDREVDPSILACSAFEQGLRMFDIRDLGAPRELGYFNPGGDGRRLPGSWAGVYSGYTAAMPQFDPVNKHIWFTDQDRGFYVVKPSNGTWITDITEETVSHGI